MTGMHILLSMFILLSTAHAALFDHLKPALGKGKNHYIRNIDFIYLINLDNKPEKYAQAKIQLEQYKIYPYRFSAVNGWELPLETIEDIGLKYRPGMTPLMATSFVKKDGRILTNNSFMTVYGKTYFMHGMTLGTIGRTLSHISVLQDAYDSGYETIWVLQDDIQVLKNPKKISNLVRELDQAIGRNNWDLLFTDINYRLDAGQYVSADGAVRRPDMDCNAAFRFSPHFTNFEHINSQFRKMPVRYSANSLIIRRSGIEKLLQFYHTHNIYAPYDLENSLPEEIQRYGLTFDLVTNNYGSLSENWIYDYLQRSGKK